MGKNNRDPKNIVYGFYIFLKLFTDDIKSYGSSITQHGKLLYDDTQYLLAMAVGDQALFGINSILDLWQLEIPAGENELILQWTDNILSLPILRNATMQGVSKDPLPKATFNRNLKSVLELSGNFGTATVHAIRCDLGGKVESK